MGINALQLILLKCFLGRDNMVEKINGGCSCIVPWPATKAEVRDAYNGAVENDRDSFQLNGMVFLVSYAKYLLVHLDGLGVGDNELVVMPGVVGGKNE